MGIKCRLVKKVGTRATLRTYWGSGECPNAYGNGSKGIHNAHILLAENDISDDNKIGGAISDHPIEKWPTKCDNCPAVVPEDKKVHRQIFRRRIYSTESGELGPGDMYWIDYTYGGKHDCWMHTTCDGMHLHVRLPNNRTWDIDSQASNCTKKKDKVHRCWIRTGTPPNVTITKGKKGDDTCAAGAGSIKAGDYHGFLKNGRFEP